jgi:hypothetical protein
MRILKLAVVVGLLFVVSGTAGAITFEQPYTGPIRFKFASWDMATTYNTSQIAKDTVFMAPGINNLPQTPPPGGSSPIPSGFGNAYAGQNEDQWGIYRVTEIRSDDGKDTLLWSGAKDNTSEIVGMFYGIVDNALYIDSTTGAVTIQSDGAQFKMFAQQKGTFSAEAGSSGRTAFNAYNTVGVSNSMLLLQGVATEGVTPIAGTTGPATKMTKIDANTGIGKGDMYIDITGGAWQEMFADDVFAPPSPDGDLLLQSTLYPVQNRNGVFDWTMTNDDPMRGTIITPENVIPEPISMLTILGSMAGLGGYLKRRRA